MRSRSSGCTLRKPAVQIARAASAAGMPRSSWKLSEQIQRCRDEVEVQGGDARCGLRDVQRFGLVASDSSRCLRSVISVIVPMSRAGSPSAHRAHLAAAGEPAHARRPSVSVRYSASNLTGRLPIAWLSARTTRFEVLADVRWRASRAR